ncbi:hypothetical protein HNQ88_000465 [Aureibacter tunicatorum]|uniref:Uncharacterized protein n=1 Tax=Aureibacter tunicatorum TaxID=866807 RepID=A0AAE4BP28_9BACT|nr:hypothetical protein [Aureibacter tunicatorum]BDD02523.1 hypothetical protein AUTU_00060 [Aureibacter tunicatorum]
MALELFAQSDKILEKSKTGNSVKLKKYLKS